MRLSFRGTKLVLYVHSADAWHELRCAGRAGDPRCQRLRTGGMSKEDWPRSQPPFPPLALANPKPNMFNPPGPPTAPGDSPCKKLQARPQKLDGLLRLVSKGALRSSWNSARLQPSKGAQIDLERHGVGRAIEHQQSRQGKQKDCDRSGEESQEPKHDRSELRVTFSKCHSCLLPAAPNTPPLPETALLAGLSCQGKGGKAAAAMPRWLIPVDWSGWYQPQMWSYCR